MAHKAGWQGATFSGQGPMTPHDEYARTIDEVDLPSMVRKFADRYDRVVGHRDRFLWKWIHNLFDEFTLSSVPRDVLDDVREQKTLLTMFITTLDDLAERSDRSGSFDRSRWIPFEDDSDYQYGTEADRELIEFLCELWKSIETGIERAPRYAEFVDVFEYDLRQTINAMEYARVLNTNPAMANRTETDQYDAYNMSMFPYACVDLMYSPSFDRRDLGALRSLLCDLQQMARIGNWVTTWERELAEGDFSSGIVVCAIRRGVITASEAKGADPSTVDRLIDRIKSHGIESEFLREWEIRHKAVRKRTAELHSVDGEAIVDGLETVMNHHLASDGYK
jgi:hypothetical protein